MLVRAREQGMLHSKQCAQPRQAQHAKPTVVLGAALAEVVDALRDGLVVRSIQRRHALVYLDSGNDTLLEKQVNETGLAVGCHVEERLFEHDHAGDVLAHASRGIKELAIRDAVLTCVLNSNLVEALAYRPDALITGENALPGLCHRGCCRDELRGEARVGRDGGRHNLSGSREGKEKAVRMQEVFA